MYTPVVTHVYISQRTNKLLFLLAFSRYAGGHRREEKEERERDHKQKDAHAVTSITASHSRRPSVGL